jgi:hypothetical protein
MTARRDTTAISTLLRAIVRSCCLITRDYGPGRSAVSVTSASDTRNLFEEGASEATGAPKEMSKRDKR